MRTLLLLLVLAGPFLMVGALVAILSIVIGNQTSRQK